MSLRITRTGILDTIQDLGRFGYQYLGINPGGAMDRYAARLANILAGNEREHPVIELHYPASAFLFDKPALIAITGADFTPMINGQPLALNQPVIVSGKAELQFTNKITAARSYLAVNGLRSSKWLNSASTNLKIAAGGYQGRALKKGDELETEDKNDYSSFISGKEFIILPWKVVPQEWTKEIFVIPGHEWEQLDSKGKTIFLNSKFRISNTADRMGYQLEGPEFFLPGQEELVSSGVSFGTIQLLPNGQLIVLMADHQTTGGYPRLAHVISAHLPNLAQLGPGEELKFSMVDIRTAEDLLLQQQHHLLQLQNACKFRLAEFIR